MMSWTLQVQYFFSTAFLGIALGFFFHFYWLILRSVRPGKRLITLTDILFCFFLLLLLGGALLLINAGDLRFYVWLALLLGGWIYKKWIFRPLSPFLETISRGLLKGCGFFTRFIGRPLWGLAKRLNRLWKRLWIKGKTPEESSPEEP